MIPLKGWFPARRAELDRMSETELLALAQLAEDMEIKARLAGDAYGQQVAREKRGLAERAYVVRRRCACASR